LRAAVAGLCLMAAPLWAASDDNTLVLDIAGEASGSVVIKLFADVAPNHVAQIKRLVRDGKYDNVVFHRVIDGFMAQTGDVKYGQRVGFNLRYAGTGGSDFPDLKAEFSDIPFTAGVVGMARSQNPDSANSQFFIMFADAPFLNGQYTVVGKVIEGMDVVNAIKKGARNDNGAVQEPDYIVKATIKTDQ
jgi:peptidylprolyl isomerase